MYCHLSKQASSINFAAVRQSLQLEEAKDIYEYSADLWNNHCEEQVKEIKAIENDLWLQECVVSLSPVLDVLAFAHKHNSVFLTAKYDVNEKSDVKHKFVITFEGNISADKNVYITSLLCLPLASQQRSLQGSPDWTCIVVGYSSGYVNLYTEKGELLLSQMLHEEAVTHLKYETYPAQHFQEYADQAEELVIVYSSAVVTIDGFGLFQTLRACRNQLARVTAGRIESPASTPLTYKKWGFQEQTKFVDCEAYGAINVSMFDHLVSESTRKGFYGTVKPSMTPSILLVTIGSNPYVGFYHATEGKGQKLLTDVVQAVASKLMNFISHTNTSALLGSFIGRNEPDPTKNKPKVEPSTTLPLRFGIYDKRRQGLSALLSPNKALSLITDAFGRVILLDVVKGVVVRMWKGYRDAQCGWVEVEEDMKKSLATVFDAQRRKHMFFVVIYAPRRGILEVWSSQQGPRIGAFNVGKSGRLLSPGYAIVGANFSAATVSNCQLSACYFLSSGCLKRIIVPSSICGIFPLSLSERNSKRFRDLQYLKELKSVLKSLSEKRNAEVVRIMKNMKTHSILLQALGSLCTNRLSSVDLVEEVMVELLSHLEKQESGETDYEMKLLKQSCFRSQQLVNMYKSISVINIKAAEELNLPALSGTGENPPLDLQHYTSSLCTSDAEIGFVLSLITVHQQVASNMKKQVRFSDEKINKMLLPEFMSAFNITDCQLQKNGDVIATKNLFIDLKPHLPQRDLENMGCFIFHGSIFVAGCHSSLQQAIRDSGILPERLLHILIGYWLSCEDVCNEADKWLNLQQTIKHISSLTANAKSVSSDAENVSLWWKPIRDILMKSNNNVAAYIGAIVARSVSVVMAAALHEELKIASGDTKSFDEKSESGESDWEAVSLDLEHWNFLVKQLEEVFLLTILLKSQPFPTSHATKGSPISVAMLLNAGQGTVSDLIAVWAVSCGFPPQLLSMFLLSGNEEEEIMPQKYINDSNVDIPSLIMVKGVFDDLKKKFPYSLSHDVLLSNCAWEHLMQWNLNKDVSSHLDSTLTCFDLIQSSVVKNRFASMMWKTCVQKKFEVLALLIEKIGKPPNERICRKELEMGDNRLENLIDFCCRLLNIILETSLAAEVEELPKYKSEGFWHNQNNQGPMPLILMALGQKVFCSKSVYQHLILATILHLTVTFQMNNMRPIGLFNAKTKKAFFGDLHSYVKLKSEKEDLILEPSRRQFLIHTTSAIAQNVAEAVPDLESNTSSAPTHSEPIKNDAFCTMESYRLASKWFNKVIDLGRDWQLNLDELRRHFVCELYSSGQDFLAQEIMSAVTEKSLLASQLLVLCGHRVFHLVFDSNQTVSRIGYLSPDLVAWLKTLEDRKLRCNNVPLADTLIMTNHILSSLPEGCKEQVLAQSIQDALKGFLDVYKNQNS